MALKDNPVCTPYQKQRWLTIVHNRSKAMAACDFFLMATTRDHAVARPGPRPS